jgi:6-phosphofructokinase
MRHDPELTRRAGERPGAELRHAILGHLQRGGATTPFDRLLATQFATGAVELLARRRFNRMVCLQGGRIGSVPLSVPGKAPRLVSPRSPLIQTARSIGTCFGDEAWNRS